MDTYKLTGFLPDKIHAVRRMNRRGWNADDCGEDGDDDLMRDDNVGDTINDDKSVGDNKDGTFLLSRQMLALHCAIVML